MSDYSSIGDTLDHKAKVMAAMGILITDLLRRAGTHDNSKLQQPERAGYDSLGAAMQGVSYGTPDYFAVIAAHQDTVDHHYAHNRHHPEHFPQGVAGMDLMDLVEMVTDWEGSAQRRGAGLGETQARALCARFQIEPQLTEIIVRTLPYFAGLRPDPPEGP